MKTRILIPALLVVLGSVFLGLAGLYIHLGFMTDKTITCTQCGSNIYSEQYTDGEGIFDTHRYVDIGRETTFDSTCSHPSECLIKTESTHWSRSRLVAALILGIPGPWLLIYVIASATGYRTQNKNVFNLNA